MIKEGKIGAYEAVWLATITITSKAYFSSPSVIASLVGTAGWYMTLISALVALIGFGFIYLLLKRFPDKDIIDIFEVSFGRAAGFILLLVLGLFLLFMSVTRISEFHEIMRVNIFQMSPDWFIVGIAVVSVLVFSLLGFEAIARFAKFVAYFMLAGFLALTLLGLKNYRTENLFPILGYGIDKTLINGVMRSSAYGEIIIFAVFARSFQGTK
jgi:amino acid transporter